MLGYSLCLRDCRVVGRDRPRHVHRRRSRLRMRSDVSRLLQKAVKGTTLELRVLVAYMLPHLFQSLPQGLAPHLEIQPAVRDLTDGIRHPNGIRSAADRPIGKALQPCYNACQMVDLQYEHAARMPIMLILHDSRRGAIRGYRRPGAGRRLLDTGTAHGNP